MFALLVFSSLVHWEFQTKCFGHYHPQTPPISTLPFLPTQLYLKKKKKNNPKKLFKTDLCCLFTIGCVTFYWSYQGLNSSRKLALPIPELSVVRSSLIRGGTWCSPPLSMLESGLAWSCTGLVHVVTISVGLYGNCPRLHVSETLFHCCQPLFPALTNSLLPFCKDWEHSQRSLCLTTSRRPGPHCSSQCVFSWCVVKSLSSCPCWASVYLFLLCSVWMFGLFFIAWLPSEAWGASYALIISPFPGIVWKTSPVICSFPFYFLNSILAVQKVFISA